MIYYNVHPLSYPFILISYIVPPQLQQLQLPPRVHIARPFIHRFSNQPPRLAPFLAKTPPDPPRPPIATRLLGKLHRREVMLVLLHRRHPRHIVKRHHPEPEIRVVGNQRDLSQEFRQCGRRQIIDSRNEIGRSQAVLIGWRASGLAR